MRALRGLLAVVAAILCLQVPAFGQAEDSIGVVALVNPDAVLARAVGEVVPEAGQDIFLNDRMTTDSAGQVHLMLVDKSSFTVGPNSDITIDRFIYDPATRAGEMALSAARGVMRFVGGDLSKNNPVEIQTSIGTLGIRGGIMLLEVSEGGGLTAVFSFGTSLSFTGANGIEATPVVRPGFMIQVAPNGAVSPAVIAPPAVVEGLLLGLEAAASTQFQDPSSDPESEQTTPAPQGGPPPLPGVGAQTQALVQSLIQSGVTSITQTETGQIIVEFDDDAVELADVVEQQVIETVQEIAAVETIAEAIEVLVRLEAVNGNTSYQITLDGATVDATQMNGQLLTGSPFEFNITSAGNIELGLDANLGGQDFQVSAPNGEFTTNSAGEGKLRITVNADGTASAGNPNLGGNIAVVAQ